MKTHLIVGFGEVGRALFEVLSRGGLHCDALDTAVPTPSKRWSGYDGIHICVPYGGDFNEFVATIDEVFHAHAGGPNTIVVIHSTVPLGTTRAVTVRLRLRLVHSPVRGTHPDMREGLLTFPKCVGGRDAQTVCEWFSAAKMDVRLYADSETTEAMKLWDTTQYGWQIVLAKEIAKWCAAHGLNFHDVYSQANRDYNAGYEKLGRKNVQRPVLVDMPGPIGGHCVVPNLSLLGPNFITDVIESANTIYAEAPYVHPHRGDDHTSERQLALEALAGSGVPLDGASALATDELRRPAAE